ncbi:unnamed protein product [Paramecium sonneborni]|uniref:Uncharacterized protein n=1 Tax=Paramecium sonneborni TaxID=65129 RepID=A0A8S1JXV4_9CILI|nr:unnamed protein product [Paramecium sonneborni]
MIENASKMIKQDKIHLIQFKHLNIHEDEQDHQNLNGIFQKLMIFHYFFNDISTLKLEILIDERKVPLLNITQYIIFNQNYKISTITSSFKSIIYYIHHFIFNQILIYNLQLSHLLFFQIYQINALTFKMGPNLQLRKQFQLDT